jgi:hypothetical protein
MVGNEGNGTEVTFDRVCSQRPGQPESALGEFFQDLEECGKRNRSSFGA